MIESNVLEQVEQFSIFGEVSKLGHEQVVFCHDEPTGLKAIIAIHNTVLGPALGGTRMWNYASDQEALVDVLRLSRGMTFKAAISGLNLGGGKAVIIGDAKKMKSEAFMRRFGRFVESLGGRYITAEDVNTKTRDMEYIAMETNHVTGLPESMGGGGDPSPVTAYGTYVGMKAAVKKVYGSDSLAGKKISVQGVGQVGGYLVKHLVEEGATVYITDISEDRLKYISQEYKAHVVGQDEIYDLDVDIYAPCALGATLNTNTINRLKCKVVAGAANNQLADEVKHGNMLIEKGITLAPDFLINAGGLINVYAEFLGGYKAELAYQQAEKIYDTCLTILNNAEVQHITTQEAAMQMALKRIEDMGKVKLAY
ncbi:Glu/Leu/Phe/Val dehydrogenase dimerization domain-containing protein [Cytophagales bacterium LB-30]|uniref:Glu/Leu/Phe/Val dehydrogenase dimerization domain-containing protein n=1 Tax=Shiella aurantiaca TaxID=3058365 RepID=A0ABT8F6B8_9BACT|nr:Glu/Leu/Phe/Val dehydrogenase dimerization domain-containing protein [Shiella aurantiaca]MDN4165977.1 Glu/Leu/Phe/Val dehydrogenase dimerization domain-containing protein [Shiella aurantiaca]